MRQELPSRPTDDIDGQPPPAQNTPICTATRPLNLDPQAARNGGFARGYQGIRYTGTCSFYRCWAPGPVPLARLIATAVARWRIEVSTFRYDRLAAAKTATAPLAAMLRDTAAAVPDGLRDLGDDLRAGNAHVQTAWPLTPAAPSHRLHPWSAFVGAVLRSSIGRRPMAVP